MKINEFKINRVQRISNQFLKHMYASMKELTRTKNPTDTPLEYKLFHGTGNDIARKICKAGFNRSFCGKNGIVYGCGVYFARDARYSHTYSIKSVSPLYAYSRTHKPEYCMILSRVLVGMYERGNSHMRDTNTRPGQSHQYDSTVDNEFCPTIFVVYKDFQALPEYLIHYS